MSTSTMLTIILVLIGSLSLAIAVIRLYLDYRPLRTPTIEDDEEEPPTQSQ